MSAPNIIGTMIVTKPSHSYERSEGAVACVDVYGPRGGHKASELIDKADAESAINRLCSYLGVPAPKTFPASKLDTLLNAVEAVLDSEGGIASMGELADALKACGGGDYTSNYPNLTGETV